MRRKMETEELLAEREAAKFLKQSHRTLQQWRWRHVGPNYVKSGRNVRYRLSELLKFLEKNEVDVSGEHGEI